MPVCAVNVHPACFRVLVSGALASLAHWSRLLSRSLVSSQKPFHVHAPKNHSHPESAMKSRAIGPWVTLEHVIYGLKAIGAPKDPCPTQCRAGASLDEHSVRQFLSIG